MKVLIYNKKTLSGRYESLGTKEKSSWVMPKVVAVACGSGPLQLFITKLKTQFKWSFTEVVVTGARCLRERSPGELRLYEMIYFQD